MDAPPLKVRGLDHVVVRVRDMQRALRFYRDVLGLQVEHRVDEVGLVMLRAGAALVDLQQVAPTGDDGAPAPAQRNMDHFALQVAEFDEGAIRQLLASHGVEAGEVAVRYGAEGEGPSLYVRDPDGNTVELKASPAP